MHFVVIVIVVVQVHLAVLQLGALNASNFPDDDGVVAEVFGGELLQTR